MGGVSSRWMSTAVVQEMPRLTLFMFTLELGALVNPVSTGSTQVQTWHNKLAVINIYYEAKSLKSLHFQFCPVTCLVGMCVV